MGFICEKRGDMALMGIEGPMTVYEISALHEALKNCLEEADGVTLNLGGVTDCDLAGLQLLYSASLTANSRGRRFSIDSVSAPVAEAAQRGGLHLDEIMNPGRGTDG